MNGSSVNYAKWSKSGRKTDTKCCHLYVKDKNKTNKIKGTQAHTGAELMGCCKKGGGSWH